jgi:hypothetical protein
MSNSGSSIVDATGLLKEIPALKRRQLYRLRKEKKIPYLRLGARGFLYDTNRVLEALKKLEVF